MSCVHSNSDATVRSALGLSRSGQGSTNSASRSLTFSNLMSQPPRCQGQTVGSSTISISVSAM